MPRENQEFLLIRCIDQQEPCVPGFGEESWFSMNFVGTILGYDSPEYFAKLVNRYKLPRHPFQSKCIRFSDTARIEEQAT